jgi:hypothetical protein
MHKKASLSTAEILDDCITRLQSGDDGIKALRHDFPHQAQELAPLAEIARQLSSGLHAPAASADFARNSKIRLLNRLRAAQTPTKAAKPRMLATKQLSWRPARAIATLLIAFALLLTSTGVARASSDALPGDVLYPVKRGVEEIRLAVTFNESGDAELLNAFTTERVDEIEALILAGRDEYLDDALEDYEVMLERLVAQVTQLSQSEDQKSLDQLAFGLSHQVEVLERVKANAPADVQMKMEEVKEQTQHGKDVVETIRQGGNPSDLAPGQVKKQTPQSDSVEEDHGPVKTKTPKPKEKKTPGPPPWANPGGQDKKDED